MERQWWLGVIGFAVIGVMVIRLVPHLQGWQDLLKAPPVESQPEPQSSAPIPDAAPEPIPEPPQPAPVVRRPAAKAVAWACDQDGKLVVSDTPQGQNCKPYDATFKTVSAPVRSSPALRATPRPVTIPPPSRANRDQTKPQCTWLYDRILLLDHQLDGESQQNPRLESVRQELGVRHREWREELCDGLPPA